MIGGMLYLSAESPDIIPLFVGISKNQKSNPLAVKTAFDKFYGVLHELEDGMNQVFGHLIRIKGARCRLKVIQLFSYFLKVNINRGKLRYDPRLVASDGFMLNLNYAMLTLCDPIIKKDFKKKLDARYFLIDKKDAIFTWEDSTRMSATSDELKEMSNELDKDPKVKFGFSTEIFCLTLESLHLGFSSVQENVNRDRDGIDS